MNEAEAPFTCVSEGYPLRRFELTSKAGQVGELVDAWHDGLLSLCRLNATAG